MKKTLNSLISPDWNKYSNDSLEDNKYNIEFPVKPHRPETMVPFPGYIENSEHPFTFCCDVTSNQRYNGNIYRYSGTDSRLTFKKNLRKQPKTWKYRKKDVTYKLNNSGYRTYEWDDIDWKNAIVIFGCSCTYGVGLAENETISHYIEKYTGRQTVNLGFPGGSNNLILDNAAKMVNDFDMPYTVILNWTCADRFRYYHEDGYHDAGAWDSLTKKYVPQNSKWSIDINDYWKKTFYNPTNELVKSHQLSKYADAIFNNKTNYIKISFFQLAAHATRSDDCFKISNNARDLLHPGEDNSIEIAKYIVKRTSLYNE